MTAQLEFTHRPAQSPTPVARRQEILADAVFGRHFTDHMVTATWTPDRGWYDGAVVPYGPLNLDPAAAVLHFGQEILEGLKAYRHADGSIWMFRPDANAARFARSARRLALPELAVEDFVAALDRLVRIDRDWVPSGEGRSLYLRPFMFASEGYLQVRAARHVTFGVIASPAASYFGGQAARPVTLWLSEEYTRAAAGGTGAAKCGGNYAASLIAQREAIENGCDQVAFLDSVEGRWVEESGSMNLFVVYDDGRIVTPELTGTILEGITRDSILTLASEWGYAVEERRLDVNEWRTGLASGQIPEVFACGTAAVVTPIGMLRWRGGQLRVGHGDAGPVTARIRRHLLDLQEGRTPDTRGWLHRVC
ncbi:branched-chain amino acid aminotransferase [Actinopolymorpha alba]|uniref:branched-chain amino acid aminotransferase n=1 Tax=Actinopolymorpha alba TaxID=533267 RepID=UPI00037049B4|nr:branched-chain amino acid aminotransferase [Actinopolymorpha alba]